MKRCVFILTLFIASVSSVVGQVSVSASLDSAVIKMGQQTNLSFTVSQSRTSIVRMPVFSDEITKDVFIVDVSADTTANADNITVTQNFVLTAFQPGTYTIPPFVCKDENDKEYSTQQLSLEVRDVNVEFEEGHIPEDIKNIYDPPFPAYVWVIICAALFLMLAASVFAYIYWKKHREDPEPYVMDNAIANSSQPELTALEMIEQLRDSKIWQNKGQEKLFFTKLTDILRQYLMRRFKINAMEMTSSELVDALRKVDVSYIVRDKLKQVCFTGDMTKFAKHEPGDSECIECISLSEEIIKLTAPAEENNAEEKKVSE